MSGSVVDNDRSQADPGKRAGLQRGGLQYGSLQRAGLQRGGWQRARLHRAVQLVALLGATLLTHASIMGADVVAPTPEEAARIDAVGIDDIMDQDPLLSLPESFDYFDPELQTLWLRALARPESDLQRQAAESITRAQRRGMPDLQKSAGVLLKTLETPDQHPSVRIAVARALIAIDARTTAPALLEHAQQDGLDMAMLVEPALARWDFSPARDIWLQRLANPDLDRRKNLLAIRGVKTVKETRAIPALNALVMSGKVSPDLRIEAAQALGHLQPEGLEADAQALADRGNGADIRAIVERLLATWLLRHHDSELATQHLQQLAVDAEPAVAANALRRLVELDARLILPFVEQTIRTADANVRELGAQALYQEPSPAGVSQLGTLLSDPHPRVRNQVRKWLGRLAVDPQLNDSVRSAGMSVLDGDDWRGLEQASLLLVTVDHKPAAPRLVELLDFDRIEVCVTAAWSLRKLAVPEVLEGMLAKVQRETRLVIDAEKNRKDLELRLMMTEPVTLLISQLNQAFGEMNYQPAVPILKEYIPKRHHVLGGPARSGAIWALGKLFIDNPQADLTAQFVSRMMDRDIIEPELVAVQTQSAIAVGRMNAPDGLAAVRSCQKEYGSAVIFGAACVWALERMTGEVIPKPEPYILHQTGWFLERIPE